MRAYLACAVSEPRHLPGASFCFMHLFHSLALRGMDEVEMDCRDSIGPDLVFDTGHFDIRLRAGDYARQAPVFADQPATASSNPKEEQGGAEQKLDEPRIGDPK